jgi:hypothetical protein
MTSEKTGSHLEAMKEYLGIGEYTTFFNCIKEEIGPRIYQNEEDDDDSS